MRRGGIGGPRFPGDAGLVAWIHGLCGHRVPCSGHLDAGRGGVRHHRVRLLWMPCLVGHLHRAAWRPGRIREAGEVHPHPGRIPPPPWDHRTRGSLGRRGGGGLRQRFHGARDVHQLALSQQRGEHLEVVHERDVVVHVQGGVLGAYCLPGDHVRGDEVQAGVVRVEPLQQLVVRGPLPHGLVAEHLVEGQRRHAQHSQGRQVH
mmetsp:Transcript_43331/g.72231  ORF Transcript_43331/g.72231 Transcript_43331/m.72231 type:complete len:204 (-) Transcript_43331:882-1493(-)